jgi:hypothetical protein
MAVADTCFYCGRDVYIECTDDVDGKGEPSPNAIWERIRTKTSITRAVTETEGATVCNELTNYVETEVCPRTKSIEYTLGVSICDDEPTIDHADLSAPTCPQGPGVLAIGTCKWFRVQLSPFDGTNYFQFLAMVNELQNLSFNKNDAVETDIALAVAGDEVVKACL